MRSVSRFALAAALGVCATGAFAQSQLFFTVKPENPSFLPTDTVFATVGGVPTPVGGGSGMGLSPLDEIDGIAQIIIPGLRSGEKFIICFGVDPFATGVSRFRIPLQNVFSQALNGQEAGDAFLSTEAFERGVGVLPPPFSMGLNNNALAVNQSERYPNVFGLLPLASPNTVVAPGTLIDDVAGTLMTSGPTPPALFFTLTRESPALQTLPGEPSGATILLDPDFNNFGDEQLYANPSDLNLVADDDIDALIVFDEDLDGQFGGIDTVYFSLTPDSPTLAALGLGPGDVLFAEPGAFGLFADAAVFGLLAIDNMDAMDPIALVNDSAEDTINSMITCPSDFNGDTVINTLDVMDFLNAWMDRDPRTDHDGDGVINTRDVLFFLNDWTSGC